MRFVWSMLFMRLGIECSETSELVSAFHTSVMALPKTSRAETTCER